MTTPLSSFPLKSPLSPFDLCSNSSISPWRAEICRSLPPTAMPTPLLTATTPSSSPPLCSPRTLPYISSPASLPNLIGVLFNTKRPKCARRSNWVSQTFLRPALETVTRVKLKVRIYSSHPSTLPWSAIAFSGLASLSQPTSPTYNPMVSTPSCM